MYYAIRGFDEEINSGLLAFFACYSNKGLVGCGFPRPKTRSGAHSYLLLSHGLAFFLRAPY
jgi:hypothetical protein